MPASATATAKPGLLARLLFGRRFADTPALIPGVLLAALVVGAAVALAELLNSALGQKGLIGTILMAIVIGFALGNTLRIPERFAPGIAFCVSKLLRLGIILMGIRLSVLDAARIGLWGVPIVVVCIGTGLVLTTYFARLLRLPERLGTLMAVGTSICGVSAIVATAPVIEAEEREVAYAVANITVFGLTAMMVYPYLAHLLFHGNPVMAGLFLGTAIHDTSQVTGAALIYDQTFGVAAKPTVADVAIVTKLVRNVFIAVVIPLMAFVYARRLAAAGGGTPYDRLDFRSYFPVFILGFIAMATFRSLGDAGLQHGGLAAGLWTQAEWTRGVARIADLGGYALAAAMAGVGLGTQLRKLKGLGLRPFLVGFFAALVVSLTSAVAVAILGPHVSL